MIADLYIYYPRRISPHRFKTLVIMIQNLAYLVTSVGLYYTGWYDCMIGMILRRYYGVIRVIYFLGFSVELWGIFIGLSTGVYLVN